MAEYIGGGVRRVRGGAMMTCICRVSHCEVQAGQLNVHLLPVVFMVST